MVVILLDWPFDCCGGVKGGLIVGSHISIINGVASGRKGRLALATVLFSLIHVVKIGTKGLYCPDAQISIKLACCFLNLS